MISKRQGVYSLSLYFAQGISLILGFFIAKILKPTNYGYYATGKIIISYALLFSLGLPNALIKIIPSLSEKESKKVLNTAISFSFIHVIPAFIFAIFLIYVKDVKITYRTIVLFYSVILFSMLRDIIVFYFRGRILFTRLSLTQIIAAGLMAIYIFFLYFIGQLRVWKALFGIVVYAIPFVFQIHSFRFSFDFSIYKKLLKSGLPLLIAGMISALIFQLDRWFIIFSKDIKYVGYYSFAAAIAGIFYIFPAALSHIAYPQMIQSKDKDELFYAQTHIKTLLLFTPILVIFIKTIAGFVIRYFLFEYLPAINSMNILLITMIFSGVLNILYGVWISRSQWERLIFYQFVPLLVNFMLNYYFLIIMKKDIVFAAYATLVAMIVYLVVVTISLNYKMPYMRFIMALLISLLSFLNLPVSFAIWLIFAYGCYRNYI